MSASELSSFASFRNSCHVTKVVHLVFEGKVTSTNQEEKKEKGWRIAVVPFYSSLCNTFEASSSL
ncbi:hypothetical protein SDJN02_23426, partial [Cucurbita argyrosperma subsp. argyrosperma]